MRNERLKSTVDAISDITLRVYLLGSIDFDTALTLQRRLVYEVSGDRDQAALIICEHGPLITVGRHGSFAHITFEPEELHARQWRVRWVNRGGGCQLHVPGQIAMYPILPLDRLGAGVNNYLAGLNDVFSTLLDDFSVRGAVHGDAAGVRVGGRFLTNTGIAVRDWVSYYGAVFNMNPTLEPFRHIQCGGAGEKPMTSLERERRGPLSPALVRQRLLEHFTHRFRFSRYSLFTDHPLVREGASAKMVETV